MYMYIEMEYLESVKLDSVGQTFLMNIANLSAHICIISVKCAISYRKHL